MATEQNIETKLHQLEELLKEQETSAKLLVRRDMELARANERLRDLDQVKSKFVSVAAHQMRTPLSAIRWALTMMLQGDLGPVSDSQKKVLEKSLVSTDRLIKLISDLLDIDHMESGRFLYTPQTFNISELIQGVVDDLTSQSKHKGVEIVFVPSISAVAITADPEKIRLAMENVIENAVKYTPKDGEVLVSIVMKENGMIEIQVKDSGIGIPHDEQKFVFNRFFRSSNAMHNETEGSGLGLYIAKEIILYHGGTVRFESKEHEGTTFFIELPLNLKTPAI
jgi:signal transduction histidine kinase